MVWNMLVAQSEDIGWFQSPANIGFVVIGLLYGEGDFKNSVLYTVNCGDDTDCTAGTIGAILGILYGTAGIPSDWQEYIGDEIKTMCVNTHYRVYAAKTCTELTERILRMIPTVFLAHRFPCELVSGEDVLPDRHFFPEIEIMKYLDRSPWSFELPHLPHIRGHASYDRAPVVKTGEQIKLRLRLINFYCSDAYNLRMRLILPDGWTADYTKTVPLGSNAKTSIASWEATVTVGETQAKDHIYLIGESPIHAQPLIVDFPLES